MGGVEPRFVAVFALPGSQAVWCLSQAASEAF